MFRKILKPLIVLSWSLYDFPILLSYKTDPLRVKYYTVSPTLNWLAWTELYLQFPWEVILIWGNWLFKKVQISKIGMFILICKRILRLFTLSMFSKFWGAENQGIKWTKSSLHRQRKSVITKLVFLRRF
jgi:hypothetical protein